MSRPRLQRATSVNQGLPTFWSIPASELLRTLGTSPSGLSSEEAGERLARHGYNLVRSRRRLDVFTLLLSQFKSPIVLILILAAGLSFFLADRSQTLIIIGIVLASGLLGFRQEWGAAGAVDKLLAIVQVKSVVRRDGNDTEVPVERIVPGDIVLLNAGDVIPGDCLILESKDLFVDEAALTGETYPVEKNAGVVSAVIGLSRRTNSLFMGTHVISGSAMALVVVTGRDTEFGSVSSRLELRPPETDFEHGVRRFGYFLMEVTLVLVIAIFAINVYLARPVLQSFLFALALAVGLTPQLLPAIISVNLAQGARQMALRKVIVKRLASIEDFGSMNVLCSDKTGTLTEGVVRLHSAVDVRSNPSDRVLFHAYLNASYETGFTNPIDEAIRTYRTFDLSGYQKMDEVPYDFIRKRLSILVSKEGRHIMVTKGALPNVLAACSLAESDGKIEDLAAVQGLVTSCFEELGGKGFRTLGVAYKDIGAVESIGKDSETGMTFLGFLVLFDPPKPEISRTLSELNNLGVSLKIITGDSRLVATHLSQQVGLADSGLLTGLDLHRMSDEALMKQVNEVHVFAEVEPNHKERIILALQKAGNVVGYLGDGINDVSALHAADVGISVDSAVDVAKEAADIVLLEKDLGVLVQGVRDGRTTFANTLKYVFMAASANFGNMFSMAGASLFLPFLPLLPIQVLLTNLLTDFPEMTIATDSVDPELVQSPQRWNIRLIRNFMLTFGSVSSIFDFLTFGALLFLVNASVEQFRTGWFIESVISASFIVLVIRSRQPFFKSRPGKYLLGTTLLVGVFTLLLPFTPLAGPFNFTPLPPVFLLVLAGVMALYILAAEIAKKIFYRNTRNTRSRGLD